MATSPIRIRDDLYPWVEGEAQRLGVGIAALVNSMIERAAAQGRLEARPIGAPINAAVHQFGRIGRHLRRPAACQRERPDQARKNPIRSKWSHSAPRESRERII